MNVSSENLVKFFQLTETLYNADPAQVGCVENNLTDEYDSEAYIILSDFMKEGFTTAERIKIIFDDRFDGYFSEESIENVFPTIKRILNS